jgi:GxxExxY protein
MEPTLKEADLTGKIINAFYTVYDELGYGFLETVYTGAICIELTNRGVAFSREGPIDVFYKGIKVGHYKADIIVAERVVIEVKASRTTDDSDRRQLLNYLRATSLELGLMLHFGPKANFQRLIFENDRKRSLSVIARE